MINLLRYLESYQINENQIFENILNVMMSMLLLLLFHETFLDNRIRRYGSPFYPLVVTFYRIGIYIQVQWLTRHTLV